MNHNYHKRQRGVTLIEVLVSMFILVTGILGAVALQASAQKGSFDAMQRSMASALAQDIIERMRSNDSADQFLDGYNGNYGEELNDVPDTRCNTLLTLCTPQEMMTNDIYEWELSLMGADVKLDEKNNGGLLNGIGCISHLNNSVTVVISWQGREETTDAATDGSEFETDCGTASKKRRQLIVEGFIY